MKAISRTSPYRAPRPPRPVTWRQVALGLSLCLATASPLVQAQDGGAAAAALKILMTPPAAPAVQASPGTKATMVSRTKRNETLRIVP